VRCGEDAPNFEKEYVQPALQEIYNADELLERNDDGADSVLVAVQDRGLDSENDNESIEYSDHELIISTSFHDYFEKEYPSSTRSFYRHIWKGMRFHLDDPMDIHSVGFDGKIETETGAQLQAFIYRMEDGDDVELNNRVAVGRRYFEKTVSRRGIHVPLNKRLSSGDYVLMFRFRPKTREDGTREFAKGTLEILSNTPNQRHILHYSKYRSDGLKVSTINNEGFRMFVKGGSVNYINRYPKRWGGVSNGRFVSFDGWETISGTEINSDSSALSLRSCSYEPHIVEAALSDAPGGMMVTVDDGTPSDASPSFGYYGWKRLKISYLNLDDQWVDVYQKVSSGYWNSYTARTAKLPPYARRIRVSWEFNGRDDDCAGLQIRTVSVSGRSGDAYRGWSPDLPDRPVNELEDMSFFAINKGSTSWTPGNYSLSIINWRTGYGDQDRFNGAFHIPERGILVQDHVAPGEMAEFKFDDVWYELEEDGFTDTCSSFYCNYRNIEIFASNIERLSETGEYEGFPSINHREGDPIYQSRYSPGAEVEYQR